MKIARFVLKIVGASLLIAGYACLVIGFWDKIVELCPRRRPAVRSSEYDDYADITY